MESVEGSPSEMEGSFKVSTDLSEDEAKYWRNPNLPGFTAAASNESNKAAAAQESSSTPAALGSPAASVKSAGTSTPGAQAAGTSTGRYFGIADPTARDAAFDFFKHLQVFEGMEEDSLNALVDMVRVLRVPAQQYVIRAGDDGDSMFFIQDGRCAVEFNGTVVDEHGSGKFFGEVALTLSQQRIASVRSLGCAGDASQPATLLQLMRTDFEELIREYSGLQKRFAFIGQMRVRNQAKKAVQEAMESQLESNSHPSSENGSNAQSRAESPRVGSNRSFGSRKSGSHTMSATHSSRSIVEEAAMDGEEGGKTSQCANSSSRSKKADASVSKEANAEEHVIAPSKEGSETKDEDTVTEAAAVVAVDIEKLEAMSTHVHPYMKLGKCVVTKVGNDNDIHDRVQDFVRILRVFRKLSPEAYVALVSRLNVVVVPRGEAIFRQGDEGDALYIVYRGSLSIVFNGKVCDQRHVGECVGEVALTLSNARVADVYSQGALDKEESIFGGTWQSTSTDVELLQLMKHDFDQLVEGFPLVRTRIEAIGQSRVRNQARSLVESLRASHKHVSETSEERHNSSARSNRSRTSNTSDDKADGANKASPQASVASVTGRSAIRSGRMGGSMVNLSSYKVAAGNDLQRIFPWQAQPEIDLGYGLGTGQWAKTAKLRMQEKQERDKLHSKEESAGSKIAATSLAPSTESSFPLYAGVMGLVVGLLAFVWQQGTAFLPS
eukprot:Tamp_08763.p1 GENE.Tamp_08763~~Tamp_08763.p1  ORF type:complete len:742 (+),score=112.51 Tamp_08763:63-2228(+)